MRNAYKYIFISVVISAVLAAPLSGVVSRHQDKIKIQKLENAQLELEIEKKETKQQELERRIEDIRQDRDGQERTIEEKQREIERLKRELQAKRERERRENRVALAATVEAGSGGSRQGSGSCAAEIRKYDWDVNWAMSVMQKESSGDPGNHNFSHATKDDSWGCFQINLYGENARNRPSPEWLVVAGNNVKLAHEWYVRDGRTFCRQWPNTC